MNCHSERSAEPRTDYWYMTKNIFNQYRLPRQSLCSFLAMTILLLLYSLTFILNPSPAFAQTPSTSSGQAATSSSTSKESKPTFEVSTVPLPATVSPTSPLYTDLLVSNLFHSFSCLAIGQSVIGQPCLTYQFTKNAQGMLQGVPVLSQVNTSGGALGATTSVIGMLYQNPPVRTADYLASVGQGLGIVKTANAQVVGSGAAVLNPILSLWQVSRNVSYVIMIIIFVVIGLMVMFRNKLNPQTVITAQAALPGLVIGLILITFSYFLAGLISDMAFVGTNVVGYYFTAAQGQPTQNQVQNMADQNILKIFSPFTGIISPDKAWTAIGSIWDDLRDPNPPHGTRLDPFFLDPQKALSMMAGFTMFQLFSPFAGLVPGWGQVITGAITGFWQAVDPVHPIGLALSFIATVVLIYTMLKLLLRLVNAYLTIIFLTISAPFQLLFAALPGRQGTATNWILNMLANILAFPAVLAVLYFVAYLLGPQFLQSKPNLQKTFTISQTNKSEQNQLMPIVAAQEPNRRIVDKNTFPLLGGFDLGFIEIILAFGALIALPKIPDIVAQAVGKMGQAGQMIGQEIGGSIGQGQRYTGQFQQGIGGAAGQVGRLTSDRGYYLTEDAAGNTIWRKVGPDSPIDIQARLTQAGQGIKLRAGAGQLWGGIKNRFGR